jgi:quinol monooxygenase YgiN
MSADSNVVNLIATFRALPEQATRVEGLISAYADIVRQEPGNVIFEVYTDRDDPHAFIVVERYVDEDAFQAHLAGEAGKEFNAELTPLIEGGGSALQFLDPVS